MRKSIARTCREKSRSLRKVKSLQLIFTRSSRQKKQKKTFGPDARRRRMIHRDPVSSLMATLVRPRNPRRNKNSDVHHVNRELRRVSAPAQSENEGIKASVTYLDFRARKKTWVET